MKPNTANTCVVSTWCGSGYCNDLDNRPEYRTEECYNDLNEVVYEDNSYTGCFC